MAKTNRPEINNPLADMGLDDIVRGITAPSAPQPRYQEEPRRQPAPAPRPVEHPVMQDVEDDREMTLFERNLEKYTGISEQGVAIWLPKEVKKQLEMIRINASKNIPLRSLAAAIIMTYVADNEQQLGSL